MTLAPAKTRTTRRDRLPRLAAAVLRIALIASVVFWLLDRSLPGFLRRRLESALSSGPVAVSFGNASFNIFRGLSLENVRVFPKRSLAPPLVSAASICLSFEPSLSHSPVEWLSRVHCHHLYLAPYPEWEAFADSLPDGDVNMPTASDIQFSADNASVLSVRASFIAFTINAESDPGVIRLDGIRIVPNDLGYLESLSGKLSYEPAAGRLAATLSGTITPAVIRDLTLALEGDVAVEYYDAITGIQTPFSAIGEVVLSEPEGGPSLSDIRLTLSGNDFLYRGVPAQSVKFGLQWLTDSRNAADSGRRLVISPLDATFADGKLSGRLAWYPRSHATDLQAKSSLPLKTLSTVIDLPLPDCTTNVAFATPPRAEIAGRFFPPGFGADSLQGRIAATRVTAFRVPFDDLSADWYYDEGAATVAVTNFAATLASGKVDASFSASTEGDQPFVFSVNAADVRTDPLRRIFDPGAPQSDGTIALSASLSGNLATNTLASLSGSASTRIRKAAITRIPLFAGLTDFIARNVAGIDLLVMQSDSDATLVITNGLATIGRVTIDGNMMSLVSKGKWRLDAPDMPVEGVAQVRFFHSRSLVGRLARLVTLPVSKFMEFRVFGPVKNPKWNYIGIIDRIAEATFWPRGDATEKKEE